MPTAAKGGARLGAPLILLLSLAVAGASPSRQQRPDRREFGGLSSWAARASSGAVEAKATCWGPGVWPHPAHCSLFSVCRMTGSGVRGVLLRCPNQTAFVTRRWRCFPDQYTNCALRPISQELLKASMEMRIPRVDLSPKLGLCPFPKPYCSSETTLTVCAPNHLLIGNVTCPSSCMEDEFGAFCDPEVITTTTVASVVLPMLDADLMESAIKITSSLGLGPVQKTDGNLKPSGIKTQGVPAYSAPVFDLNGSSDEYSYESEQVDEDKPVFSKPAVLVQGSLVPMSAKPLQNGNKESEVFTIEKVPYTMDAMVLPPSTTSVGGGTSIVTTTMENIAEKGSSESENLEREKLEKEKLEREQLEKEKLEREKLEREKLEREKLEREKLEREKLEREKLEREKLEREKLEREKLEREKLEREKLEREKLEREKLEREKLEREKLEREKLEREKLEREKLERENLEREKLEREKLEREKLEREKLEREKLEREKLEREKLEREKLEREKVEKEKLEQKKLEMEKLIKEKLEKEKLEKERLEIENQQKLKLENKEKEEERKKEQEQLELERKKNSSSEIILQQMKETSPFSPHDLATVCRRPGLACVNSNILLECSSDLVALRAWNCGSFFSRSAVLVARCDHERDSCVATVDDQSESGEEETGIDPQPLCRRPGAQCADKATLIHCSDDLRSATVAVCSDLFPGADGSAFCDQKLDACVVGIGEGGGEAADPIQTMPEMTETPNLSVELPPAVEVTTLTPPKVGITMHLPNLQTASSTQAVIPVTERFPGKPYPSDDPSDTMFSLFSMHKDQCNEPGLRCYGGKVLEACEKDNPKPVYRMDCSAVLADSLGARCEEQSKGEATCLVALHRNTPVLKGGLNVIAPLKEEDIFTLELSVVDITKSYEYYDSEMSPWRCSQIGQYCADESTLLSCNSDLTVEFALSCGAIAPESVVAFCDSNRDACVVKKISSLTSNLSANTSFTDASNQLNNKTYVIDQENDFKLQGQHSDKVKSPSSQVSGTQHLNNGAGEMESVVGPTKWDLSTISQLYPPDVPLSAYTIRPLKSQMNLKGGTQYSAEGLLRSNCTKVGPVCLDEFHLGSCSEELELRYVLPCSALYASDPAPFCDTKLSACLPSVSKQEATTTMEIPTTEKLSTTTVVTSTKVPTSIPAATTSQPSIVVPQQLPSYHPYDYTNPANVQFGTPAAYPAFQEHQYPSGHITHVDSSFPHYPFLRPGGYTFLQRPGINSQYSSQQSRLPAFLQNILQNYGIQWPTFSQTIRPPTLSSFPLLQNILQGLSTLRPPGILQQNTKYGMYGGEEPYIYNDPQYHQYAEKFSNDYIPVSYHGILPGTQLIKEVRPVTHLDSGISPDMQSDLLKYYYANKLAAVEQPLKQSPLGGSSNVYKKRPSPQKPIQLYLDRFLGLLQQHKNEPFPQGSQPTDFHKSKLPGNLGEGSPMSQAGGESSMHIGPSTNKVNMQGVMHGSGIQGGLSQVNPLTWLGKLEVPDTKKTSICKRPGMQCVDSSSLGACSKDLKLRYVIPCRNLLPFVSVGKPYCDSDNDACGVLVDEEHSEYPTDYTSYP